MPKSLARIRFARPAHSELLAGVVIILWPQYALLGITVLLLIAFCAALRLTNLNQIAAHIACTFFGALYTFTPWRYAVDLRRESVHLLFFALALNWIGDTAAYYAGRMFGKHKLAPIVSPGKTWEGAVASVVASLLFGFLYLGNVRAADSNLGDRGDGDIG